MADWLFLSQTEILLDEYRSDEINIQNSLGAVAMRIHPTQCGPGTYIHIVNHAIDGKDLFYDPGDYKTYLTFLKEQMSEDYSVIAYCLMPNHFHFLIRQNAYSAVSALFEQPHKRYARYYNSKYDSSGRIFRNKLAHKYVMEDNYLVAACAYIHANPLQANLVSLPEDWEFSNFREFMGIRNGTLFSIQFVEDYIGNREDYRNMVIETARKKNLQKAFAMDNIF